jgi:hypothetical protein
MNGSISPVWTTILHTQGNMEATSGWYSLKLLKKECTTHTGITVELVGLGKPLTPA